jgi:hypothetical protein
MMDFMLELFATIALCSGLTLITTACVWAIAAIWKEIIR